jgi:two-component system, chemotaxis family, CheB/CheR fusion protein
MSQADERRFLDGLRVLLVEDSDDVRDVLALLLESDGAAVRAAPSARIALETAAEWDFDVLLTDLGLPDLPGDRLIREILGMKAAPPRVVAVTGFGASHVALAKRAGAEVVFTKPLDWSALREHVAARPAVAA